MKIQNNAGQTIQFSAHSPAIQSPKKAKICFSSVSSKSQDGSSYLSQSFAALKRIVCCELDLFSKLHKKKVFADYCNGVAADLHLAERLLIKYPQYPLEAFPVAIQKKVKSLRLLSPKTTEYEAIDTILIAERLFRYKRLLQIADSIPDRDLVSEFSSFNYNQFRGMFGRVDKALGLECKALAILGKHIEENKEKSWIQKSWDFFTESEKGYAEIAHEYLCSVREESEAEKQAADLIRQAMDEIKKSTLSQID